MIGVCRVSTAVLTAVSANFWKNTNMLKYKRKGRASADSSLSGRLNFVLLVGIFLKVQNPWKSVSIHCFLPCPAPHTPPWATGGGGTLSVHRRVRGPLLQRPLSALAPSSPCLPPAPATTIASTWASLSPRPHSRPASWSRRRGSGSCWPFWSRAWPATGSRGWMKSPRGRVSRPPHRPAAFRHGRGPNNIRRDPGRLKASLPFFLFVFVGIPVRDFLFVCRCPLCFQCLLRVSMSPAPLASFFLFVLWVLLFSMLYPGSTVSLPTPRPLPPPPSAPPWPLLGHGYLRLFCIPAINHNCPASALVSWLALSAGNTSLLYDLRQSIIHCVM